MQISTQFVCEEVKYNKVFHLERGLSNDVSFTKDGRKLQRVTSP